MTIVVQILVPNLNPLDYLASEGMALNPGDLVIVPFRSKKLVGVVWKINHISELSPDKLKPIEKKLLFGISSIDLKFIHWIAEYYLFSLGQVFRMLLPTNISTWILKEKPRKAITAASPTYTQPEFNPEQLQAIKQINDLLDTKKHNIMLDGVTGSGKTEVYLAAMDKVLLNENTQILIMLPEISLTSQITDRVTKRFGYTPHIWHSNITDKQKRDSFMAIMDGSARIIIGARSGLFLPYKNLSMIIVDEEHEQSYKQEDGVTYQARDMAIMRAKLGSIPVILASASPSLESVHNINLGKLNVVTLHGRYNDNSMPQVHVIDMKKERKRNYFIAPRLVGILKENFARNQQSLLFLNRKGYSPAMVCSDCGYKVSCYACSSSMVYHKSQKKLKCHQCGYVAALPKICTHCSSEESFVACGPGVERLAEEVNELIPNAKIITITQDSFNNLKQADALLSAITNKECDIIIGTQIIAKGHHFPSLTIVGVIDADSGLMGGDLRSAEKTYQLLQQVGGRAGREIINSKIFIQTYNPEHPLILALASYNRAKFIEEEMKTREIINMPPFGRLASIILSSKQEQKLIDFAKELVKITPNTRQITVLGPAPALLYKLRSKFRYRILIKTKRNINIQHFLNTWLEGIKIPNHIHLKIDIDPYYFL